jgi:hypothetical protein
MKLATPVVRTGLMAGLAITATSAVTFAPSATAQAAPKPKPHHPVVAPLNASCGTAGKTSDYTTGHTNDNYANIRTGSNTSCASVGQAQASHTLYYYCYTSQSNGDYTWTYVRDVNTGKRGWIRDDLLSGYGSGDWCGF